MRKIEISVFSYRELTDEAKEKAKEWIFENGPMCWEDLRNTLKEFKKPIPGLAIKTKYTSYPVMYVQNNCYIDFNDRLVNLSFYLMTGLRFYKWLVNNFDRYLYRGKVYGGFISGHQGVKPKHQSKVISEKYDCPFTGMIYDEFITGPISEYISFYGKNIREEYSFVDFMEFLSKSFCQKAEETISHEYSDDEFSSDFCDANNFEFYEDGRHYNG